MTDLQPWECLMKRIVWKRLGNIRDKKILDFGSGIGVTANYLAEHNDVAAIEPDEDSIKERWADKQVVTELLDTHRANLEQGRMSFIMSNRIYYFMFENEYMDDLIKEIQEIFSICDKKDEYILSDDKDYVYILDGKEKGKGCILANRDTYVYTIYIFSNEKSSERIERMLSELAEEIEDDYNDDRYRFVKTIDYDSKVLDYCIRMANKFNFFGLIDSYLNQNN